MVVESLPQRLEVVEPLRSGTRDGDLRSRGAELLLKMSDGRALHFQLRDDDGKIRLKDSLAKA